MLIPAVLALAILAGAPWVVVGLVAAAVLHPGWFAAGVAIWVVAHHLRTGKRSGGEEAAFLRGLAAELSAGASLRNGVVAAASRAPGLRMQRTVRSCAAGRPAPEIAAALRDALPDNGAAAAAAFRLAAQTGGSAAPVAEALASRAEAGDRLDRERAASTAQARLSAWIVGGIPVGLVLLGWLSGMGPDLEGYGTAGVVLAVAGIGLIGIGSLVVWAMLRRASR